MLEQACYNQAYNSQAYNSQAYNNQTNYNIITIKNLPSKTGQVKWGIAFDYSMLFDYLTARLTSLSGIATTLISCLSWYSFLTRSIARTFSCRAWLVKPAGT